MSESTQKCPSCTETVPLEYSVCPFCGFGLLEYELRRFVFKPSLKEVFLRVYAFFRHPLTTSEEFGFATESKGGNLLLLLFSLFLSLRYYMIIIKAGIGFSSIQIGNPGEEGFGFMFPVSLLLFFITLFLMPFIVWIIYKLLFVIGTWLMAKFASMLGSEASTKQLRTVVGYSIAPIVVGEFIGILIALITPSPGSIGGTADFEAFRTFMEGFYGSTIMFIFRILMLLLWIVAIIYMSIGLRVVGKMAWINAIVAITLPIGLFVYFFYLSGLFGG
ncbi:MAG: hypothetical protein H7641_01445 [Candidatus Heimdallarchaeota archaeon]|nr:hypothetical protein [Candidatus Heimdallarchaeota archaeon]MCK4876227.1 hypothetical protein [Candidatus Heimdallarchaeota archaeon]